jgi:glucuronate isomerase
MALSREDRYFAPEPAQKQLARAFYAQVKDLPLICPHGHVDPRMLSASHYAWGSPVDLLIIPDHYVFRMLYSQGISLESLGIPRQDGTAVEKDQRKIWQTVCDHWYLFRGTPTDLWMRDGLQDIFGIDEKINAANAQHLYDAIEAQLQRPEFQPRRLFERFNIEVLATTDTAVSTLEEHQRIRDSDWSGRVIPTFRPDAVINIQPDYAAQIEQLSHVSGVNVSDYRSYIAALEQRRQFFKHMGATATDHDALTAYTERLSERTADDIFQSALRGTATAEDARRFRGHMLIEMARMSVEDGLVMQVHVGSFRNHNVELFSRFGRDMGADIPTASEFTHNLKPLLDLYGHEKQLTLILFNLDETTYGRELAPLAGHYPALRLGPPWWFFDSVLGMQHFFDAVVETAGIYNTAGFNDDTRAYPSIPVRHDVWRRVSSNWLAGQVVRGIIDEDDAHEMVVDLAYRLAKQTYKLEG